MKKICFILILLFLGGCGGLNNSWTNFTAYYNTYYNARKDFKAGLSLVEEQPIQINPKSSVRAHPKLSLAGEQDFEHVVENTAKTLRRFPDSKWTDNALLLMGKSYYYLQEYFLARQKFDELLALPSQTTLKQDAVIWKGRTLLEINAYSQGIQFLEGSLSKFKDLWSIEKKAEAQILLAEHQTMLEHWDEAAALVQPAVLRINDNELRGRAYFLLGQLFQKMNKFTLAFQAYSNVRQNFPDYEYIYWAEIKRAEVARIQGNADLAISLYTNMLKDDKNVERSPEINYQLALTYEAKDNFDEAEEVYKQILGNDQITASELQTNTYYQLGKLYSEQYQNYQLAAAYFDSSSFQAQQRIEDVDKLASAYNRYISLKQQITSIDSLLELGELNEDDLQLRLAEIRQERKEQLRESQNVVQQTNNTLANVNDDNFSNTTESDSEALSYGFLNYQNTSLVQRERSQFKAIWGNRPLVDNWRHAEALSATNISENQLQLQDSISAADESDPRSVNEMGINMDKIPRSKEAKNKLKNEVLNAEYRLGSLFFLTLEQPDSAAYYYQRVLRDSANAELRAQTLYSLYELYNLHQQPDSSAKYKNRVLDDYPNSRYAQQIFEGDKMDQPTRKFQPADTTEELNARLQQLTAPDDSLKSNKERAEKLYNLAVENRSSSLAPAIFIESIRKYIRYAKLPDTTRAVSDTVRSAKTDTLSTKPYSGSRWNRVRALLKEFQALFPSAGQKKKVETWAKMLDEPKAMEAPLTCDELGVKPKIKPSMDAFVSSVEMPEQTEGMSLSGSIRYRILVTRQGEIESYELISNPTKLGIEEAYEQAVENSLQFEPMMQDGHAVRASCEVEFPIKQ